MKKEKAYLYRKVQSLRTKKGIGFEQLANEIGMSKIGFRQALENETLQYKYGAPLCRALDCSILELFPSESRGLPDNAYFNQDLNMMRESASQNIAMINESIATYTLSVDQKLESLIIQAASLAAQNHELLITLTKRGLKD